MSGCSSLEPFALQVLDDSMAPTFPAQSIIIVDPSGHATAGAYVVAHVSGGPSLGELQIRGSAWFLAQRAGNEPVPLSDGPRAIVGVVTQCVADGVRRHLD